MRRTASTGSVKAIWLDREEVIARLRDISARAVALFPEIEEIRLFGSIARGEQTGLSDVDLFLQIDSRGASHAGEDNPIERMKPYFKYFSEELKISLDMVVLTREEVLHPARSGFTGALKESIILFRRERQG